MPIDRRVESPGLSPGTELPGFAIAFDEEAIGLHLQAALFGTDPDYVVERSAPARPLYLPGEHCLLRYRVEARSRDGDLLRALVIGRVFPTREACAEYSIAKVEPVAARMRGRPEVAPFARPAATIEELNMALHVWPIDGELPALVDATHRGRMTDLFREALPKALGRPFSVEDCAIELVSYRRRRRCVLRYTVTGSEHIVAYGKVSAVGNDTPQDAILDALRGRLARSFTVPRPLGWSPALQLALLERLPGEALIGPALKARLRGESSPGPLEDLVATCGRMAAALHTSGVELGPARTLEDDLARLRAEIAAIRRFGGDPDDRMHSWLERIATSSERTRPLRRCLAHGDFKHEQLLFDGEQNGLVDFDEVCQAEPALDVGKFLAHLRTEAQKIQEQSSLSSSLGEELAEHFLRAYVAATGAHVESESLLRLRTTLYESVALLRLAVRARQDLDEARVRFTAGVLEHRLSALR